MGDIAFPWFEKAVNLQYGLLTRMSAMRIFSAMFSFWLCCACLWAQDYREPAPGLFKIDIDSVGLSLEERALLATNLAEQCRNFTKYEAPENEFCYRALSLAFLLDPENREAIVADSILKRKAYKPVERPIPLSSNCIKYAKKLLSGGQEDEIRLAGYLMSIALRADRGNEDLIYETSIFGKKHGEVSWDAIDLGGVAGDDGPRIQRGVHPAFRNKPKEATKDLASVNALVVSNHLDGSMLGSTLEVIGTIGSTGQDNAIWRIKDGAEIGREMMVAIEEAIRVKNVRYPVVPSGSKIEFSFSDKYTPKDGGSIGLAFAILLLALFDEFEVDDKVGVTGDVTVDWKTRKIGGVVEKVMGAISSDLEIVIIPEENASNVDDLVVLHSVDPLLEVSIFSASNLEEALEIVRTDRTEGLEEGLGRLAKLQRELKSNYEQTRRAEYLAELNELIELMPNNLSAQALRKSLKGEAPKILSLHKSTEEIFTKSSSLNELLPKNPAQRMDRYSLEEIGETRRKMKEVKPLLDADTHDLHTALVEMINASEEYQVYNKKVYAKRVTPTDKEARELARLFEVVRKLNLELERDLVELIKKLSE
ncbi:S16 family serine protease [Haloferula sp.]|uniref:S16 family serine protease n=1 Tax=Haloferula sp. TaxID=2497595 RepID=UPI003C764C40